MPVEQPTCPQHHPLPSAKGVALMDTSTIVTSTQSHLSLTVSDLPRAVQFYRLLFGKEPAKHHPDYAKFEVDEPPLVLSLQPNRHTAGGALNHVGLRLPDSASLIALQQ